MGLWDKLRNQLIDIISWTDDDREIMVYRFERHGNEIKNGAKLIVREGQVAVFVNEGELADVFRPGTHELTTRNLPILTSLKSWKYGFESPFKAEVFFVATRRFTDLKWGTKNPIMLRDAEFGPIRLRAFGTYEVQVSDPATFIREVVGTDGEFSSNEISDQLRNMIITRFSDILGESRIPALDLASNYNELSTFVHEKLSSEYGEYGLEVTKFLVENISLPPAVEEALDKRSSMGVLGNLNAYTQYQMAESLPKMAESDGMAGGMAGAGLGAGMGMAMGNQMAQSFQQPPPHSAPPPIPLPVTFYVVVNGQQAGPFDQQALRRQIEAGQLSRDTLVWRQGMAQWTAAGEITEIQGLFATPPPPPAGAGAPPPIPGN